MKRLLTYLAGAAMLLTPLAAHSADLPARTYTKAPAVVPVPVFSWTGFSVTCGNFNGFGNCSNSTGGWLLGAGFEYAFTNNWTVKLEYDYLGLGSRTFVIPAGALAPGFAADTFTTNNRNVQMVKVGVNYLFNWGAPVAARY